MERAAEDRRPLTQRVVQTVLIFLFFFVQAATIPPDVNESHYLAKAKHYWDPQWCQGDMFLESADAHLVFYWTAGWLTKFFSLTTTTWIGRLTTWWLLAWSWRRFAESLFPEAWFASLSAALWTVLLYWGHLAGEWVIGGFEAKGFAYVLVLLALEAIARNQWSRVWLLLGAASSFHVLVGGWSVVAALVAYVWERESWKSAIAPLACGLVLALPGLVPALTLSAGLDGLTAAQSSWIYAFVRLDHHLVFHRLPWHHIARHALLVVCWLAAWRWLDWRDHHRRVFHFVAGSLAIAFAGIVLDVVLRPFPYWAAMWLRYYWFRLSDAMIPLGVALALCRWLEATRHREPSRWPIRLAATVLLVVAHAGWLTWEHQRDRRPPAVAQSNPRGAFSAAQLQVRYDAWRETCRWIEHKTPRDALFLTPRFQQTFKWYAQRAEVVTWKDVPQDARGLIAWYNRFREIYPKTVEHNGLVAHGEAKLLELARHYGFQWIVIDRGYSDRSLSWPCRYRSGPEERAIFEVYEVPALVAAPETVNAVVESE